MIASLRSSHFVGWAALALTVAGLAAAPSATAESGSTPRKADKAPESMVQQIPQVPLTINGKSVPASSITKYNGRPLYMAVAPGGSPNGQLRAFTEPSDFERYVRDEGGPERATAAPQRVLTPASAASRNPVRPPKRPRPTPGRADMSADAPTSWIFSGDEGTFFALGVAEFTGYADLTQVDMVCPIWCISWNDEASSAVASDNGLVLFEHIGFGGSALFIPGGWYEPFLAAYGWDNRTSSLRS